MTDMTEELTLEEKEKLVKNMLDHGLILTSSTDSVQCTAFIDGLKESAHKFKLDGSPSQELLRATVGYNRDNSYTD
jgi:hypothetical protein